MLYDPKWDNEPSIAGFCAWLETQDPRTKYEYLDNERCACAQYAIAIGKFPEWFFRNKPPASPASDIWHQLDVFAIHAHPQTFGSLHNRLKLIYGR